MKWGMIIFMLLPLLGNVYVLWHVWRILPLPIWTKVLVITLMVFAFLLLFVGFSRHVHLSMPLATVVYEIGTSWLFILLYLFMAFLLLDIVTIFFSSSSIRFNSSSSSMIVSFRTSVSENFLLSSSTALTAGE